MRPPKSFTENLATGIVYVVFGAMFLMWAAATFVGPFYGEWGALLGTVVAAVIFPAFLKFLGRP